MENESSIKSLIRDSLEQVRTIIDADTIVGKQIVTPAGVIIIPISKLSMGFASGGLDLPSKKSVNANGETVNHKNFGGGGGTGVTVVPVGFLTITPDGHVEMLPIAPEKSSPIEQIAEILNSAPDIIGRVKDVFTKGKSEISEEEQALEDAYCEKLAEDAAKTLQATAESPIEELLAEDEEPAPLTRAEKKLLRQQKKARKKLEKKGLWSPEDEEDEVEEADGVEPKTVGKVSEKTLERGILH